MPRWLAPARRCHNALRNKICPAGTGHEG